MHVSMPYTGVIRRNTLFICVWLRPMNTWICIQLVGFMWRNHKNRVNPSTSRRPRRYLCGSPPVASATRRRARQTAPGWTPASRTSMCVRSARRGSLLPVTKHALEHYMLNRYSRIPVAQPQEYAAGRGRPPNLAGRGKGIRRDRRAGKLPR